MRPQERLELYRRLGDSWHDLADYLEIPSFQQRRFDRGHEARGIVTWLEERARLAELEPALLAIGRDDLAGPAQPAGGGPQAPATGAGTHYSINISGGQGIQIGDHTVQGNDLRP